MSSNQRNNNIPLLNPVVFKEELIDKSWNPLNRPQVNRFFIHSFKDDVVPLKLPLPLHRKTVNDFAILTKGKMTKTIGLESFSLRANQFLFTPKNSITTTKDTSEDIEGFYCHFSDDFLADNPFLNQWNTQPILQNLIDLKADEMEVLLPILNRMAALYKGTKEQLSNLGLIHYYLATFIAEISTFAQKKASKITVNPLVVKFRQLVNEHFKEAKTVRYYADLLHVSPNHLNKVIKNETGKTASEIIYNTCILEAKVLLLQTDLDINQVAFRLGFDDSSYFSLFFKKHTDIAPTNYRKMIDLS